MGARLSLASDPRRTFEATLPTSNISVGGLFLESTFFLKLGTELLIELTLPATDEGVPPKVVRALGRVVRVETSDVQGRNKRSGFALQFTDYFDGSRLALAGYFLGPVLREFIDAYAAEHGLSPTGEAVAQMVDLLAAWELRREEAARTSKPASRPAALSRGPRPSVKKPAGRPARPAAPAKSASKKKPAARTSRR